MNVFAYLLGAALKRGSSSGEETLAKFFSRLAQCPFKGSVERALWAGFHADRLGFAFAGGYDAALRRLFEHAQVPLPAGHVCLAASESGGAHPRAIQTRLDKEGGALVLRGEKTFATLASASDELLVVASRGHTPDGKNRLRIVRVPRSAGGVTIEDRPPTPFAPEIPHAMVRLTDVVVDDSAVLPGDGYDVWIKPFRTIEDTHVLAATTGYLAGAARAYGWDRNVLSELVSTGLLLVDVCARDPSAPLTHVALAGVLASSRRLVASLEGEWAKASDEERARWQRDLPLMLVAENARAKRLEKALATLGSLRTS